MYLSFEEIEVGPKSEVSRLDSCEATESMVAGCDQVAGQLTG